MNNLNIYLGIIHQTIDVMVKSIELPECQYSELLFDVRCDIARDLFRLLGDKSLVIGWRFRSDNPKAHFSVLLSVLNETFKPLLDAFPKYIFEVGNRHPFADRNCVEIKFRYKL